MGSTLDIQSLSLLLISIFTFRKCNNIKKHNCQFKQHYKICYSCNPLEFWGYIPVTFYIALRILLILNGVHF